MLQCIVSPNMVVCKPTWCEFFFGYTMPLIIAIRVRFIFFYLLNHQQVTEINGIRYGLIATSKTFLGMFLCSYFSYQLRSLLFGMNSYKHHSCQLCLAP